MTDAERTPEQGSAGAPEQTEQAPGLLNKIVETAKDVTGGVVDKAKDVTSGANDRVASSAAPDAGTAATEASGGQDAASAPNEAATAPQTGVAAAVSSVVSTAGETVSTAAQTVADATAAVRKRLSRIYNRVSGGEQAATFTPPAEGGKGGRPRRFKDVSPGMQLEGKVTSIALYGIFVDVGVGRDGLVHISEMSDKRIESPTDLVEIGSPVSVWVKSVDPDARRISLTMRDPNRPKPERQERRPPRKPEVNREKLAALKSGDSVEGVVSSLAPFGAFVDIGAGKDGLVHISELAEGRIDRPEDAVTVGERYTFRVLEVDPEGNRISLSLRRALRSQRMQQLEPGTELAGTISGLAPFGAFVDIGVGRDGLVHVSELSNERINKVEDVVKVGDKVQVKIIEVDPNSKRISLTMRVAEPLPNERPRPERRPGGFGGETQFSGNRPAGFSPAPSFGGERPPMAAGDAPRPPFGGDAGGDRGARGPRTDRRSRGDRFDRPDRGDRPDDRPAATRRDRGPERNDRSPARGGGRSGGRRDGQTGDQAQEMYTFEDPEEETFTGDASLEDLLSKFNGGKGRDQRRRDDGSDEDADGQRRNDAIRRTLALRDDEQ